MCFENSIDGPKHFDLQGKIKMTELSTKKDIKTDPKEMWLEYTHLTKHAMQWQALVNTDMKFQIT
jgi:hypothetical protein